MLMQSAEFVDFLLILPSDLDVLSRSFILLRELVKFDQLRIQDFGLQYLPFEPASSLRLDPDAMRS